LQSANPQLSTHPGPQTGGLGAASSRGALAAGSRSLAAAAGPPATVAGSTVMCTFIVSKKKQKVTVPGIVGWSLLETAKHHGLLSHCTDSDGDWNYVGFGEGPVSAEDHVVVETSFFEKLAPMGYQERNILHAEVYEHLTPTSRLATCITLTKDLDGIQVIVPETNPNLTNYM